MKDAPCERPPLVAVTDSNTFRTWYWLKAELLAYCRSKGLKTGGSKADLTARIVHYLDTGDPEHPETSKLERPTSRFDWSRAEITDATVITDSYRNGPNVRAYFVARIGPRFRFTIAFMDWMRRNHGKTMAEAVTAWLELDRRRKAGERTEIPAGNQYNRYLRDFFAANPDADLGQARACWAAKRRRPGPNLYEPGDLDLLR